MSSAGTTVGGNKNKLLYELRGETVLRRSIQAFLTRSDVAQIVLPMSDESMINHVTEGHRRDENLSTAQPAGRINHQMANREARIVEVEGVDMSDITIGRADREAFEVPHASEHRWLRWECPSSWNAVSDNLGEVLMALGNQHYLCHAIAPAGSRALELVL